MGGANGAPKKVFNRYIIEKIEEKRKKKKIHNAMNPFRDLIPVEKGFAQGPQGLECHQQ